MLPPLYLRTEFKLFMVNTSEEKIFSIISSLNSKKAHGHDSISIVKKCVAVVVKPLNNLIFSKCLLEGKFPNIWKYANVQPVHKKNNRELKSNYRPISLLPVCGKILEKIAYNELYVFLVNNNLLTNHQSGFRPGDSTINQLLSITTTIFDSFENYDETRAFFLDISKAFDKVWHDGLIFKLKCNCLTGPLVILVIYNKGCLMEAGVPQGYVLGPLNFLVYINDLPENVLSTMKLFAADSSLFTRVADVSSTHSIIEKVF